MGVVNILGVTGGGNIYYQVSRGCELAPSRDRTQAGVRRIWVTVERGRARAPVDDGARARARASQPLQVAAYLATEEPERVDAEDSERCPQQVERVKNGHRSAPRIPYRCKRCTPCPCHRIRGTRRAPCPCSCGSQVAPSWGPGPWPVVQKSCCVSSGLKWWDGRTIPPPLWSLPYTASDWSSPTKSGRK